MNVLSLLIAIFLSYVLGSIPAAVWIGRLTHGIDIREHGSGNAGTTNTIRVLGWKVGIPVLLVDTAKGWTASMLPVFFSLAPLNTELLVDLQIVTGIIAIVGHIFPVLASFRGGKGVATVFGVGLAIHPAVTLCCFGVFVIVILISGISSLSSMCAGVSFPLLLLTVFNSPSTMFKIFSVVVAVALLITHRKNIARLVRGEETKLINLHKKEKPSD